MKRELTVLFLIFFLNIGLYAKSIWKDKNIYSSETNLNVGNIIVIDVNDISNMKFSISLTNKSISDITSNPDATITGFLPKISANKKISNEDRTQFSGKGNLRFSIATRIMNRAAQGMYAVAGSRTYTFSGVTNIVTVTGLVDPALIKGREIDSRNVADFTLEIKGIKVGIPLRREALKEGETADAALTEQEKQQVIIDYLQKMLGELTR